MKQRFFAIIGTLILAAILLAFAGSAQAGIFNIPATQQVAPISTFPTWKAVYNDPFYGPGDYTMNDGLYIAYGKVTINSTSFIGTHIIKVTSPITLTWDWGDVHPAIAGSNLENAVYPDSLALAGYKAYSLQMDFMTLYAWTADSSGIHGGIEDGTPEPTQTSTSIVTNTPVPTATATASPSPTATATATASPSPTATATATATPEEYKVYLAIALNNYRSPDFAFERQIPASSVDPIWLAGYEPNRYTAPFTLGQGRFYLAVGTIEGRYGVHLVTAESNQNLALIDGELIPSVSGSSLDDVATDAITLAAWQAHTQGVESLTLYSWTATGDATLKQGIWK